VGQTREGRDERYQRLLSMVDPASRLEREFLEFLYQRELRLPDTAQSRPSPEVPVQPDFYYERRTRPGVCVFIDGSVHGNQDQASRDRQTRDQLDDRGFRVVAIVGSDFETQVAAYPDVFGPLPPALEVEQTELTRASRIEQLLAQGEGEALEFKSSLRRGVPSGTVEPVVEKSILKTVAAFLNSYEGGTLIIGIEDDGNILGVEYDFPSIPKEDLDGYELHLRNLLNRDFGKDSAPLIKSTFHLVDGKHVCEVQVSPGQRPYVLVEQDKNGVKKPVLYMRTGNQTEGMALEEAVRYAPKRWPGG
jgi:Putative DNA-binding domain